MPNRRRNAVTLLFATALVVACSPATAWAAADDTVLPVGYQSGPGGWEPVDAPPFLIAAGDVCRFPVAGRFPVNEQRAYVVRDADGETRFEFVTGGLVGEFTNTSTGQTVLRDLSGDGAFDYDADGSFRLTVVGPALVGFHAGDDPAHILEVNGARSVLVVDFDAAGQRTRLVQAGPYEDLCLTLA